MDRYILIDKNSGYIFGDTADRWWKMDESHPVGPLEAAESLDRALMIETTGLSYEQVNCHGGPATYHVYTAGDEFPAVWDGQNQDIIDAVMRDCIYVTTVSRY